VSGKSWISTVVGAEHGELLWIVQGRRPGDHLEDWLFSAEGVKRNEAQALAGSKPPDPDRAG
jgi:hypothetical protein